MLLAGGQGSRLYALTQKLAKPAVPFGGKYRIIDFPLSNCVNSGIDTVGIRIATPVCGLVRNDMQLFVLFLRQGFQILFEVYLLHGGDDAGVQEAFPIRTGLREHIRRVRQLKGEQQKTFKFPDKIVVGPLQGIGLPLKPQKSLQKNANFPQISLFFRI